jgi:hypothetical protein
MVNCIMARKIFFAAGPAVIDQLLASPGLRPAATSSPAPFPSTQPIDCEEMAMTSVTRSLGADPAAISDEALEYGHRMLVNALATVATTWLLPAIGWRWRRP